MALFPYPPPVPQPKPSPSSRQAATPQPEKGNDLKSEWTTFLGQPENRAALLQFGISMLAAPNNGKVLQNVGGALGEGLEARDRNIAGQGEAAAAATAARKTESEIAENLAQAGKASRQARGPGGSSGTGGAATGALSPKERDKEWLKWWQAAKENAAVTGVAPDLQAERAEFEAVLGAGAGPSKGVQQTNISQMTLEQLEALQEELKKKAK